MILVPGDLGTILRGSSTICTVCQIQEKGWFPLIRTWTKCGRPPVGVCVTAVLTCASVFCRKGQMNPGWQEQPLLENLVFGGGSPAEEVSNLDPWKLLITLFIPTPAPTPGEPAVLSCGSDHCHLSVVGWLMSTISLEPLRALLLSNSSCLSDDLLGSDHWSPNKQ